LNAEHGILNGERKTNKRALASSPISHSSFVGDCFAEAEACFAKALDVARRRHAKALELRTAMSMARLWQRQGKLTEAQALLSEVYHWFTEGFATKDVEEAKALLDALAANSSPLQNSAVR
jgi:predicted ATPase